MNILITGSSGFVGSHLCKHLIKNNNILGICRNINKSTSNKTVKFDLCSNLNKKNLKKYFKNKNFDAVIHLASDIAKERNINTYELFENNIKITKNMIEIIKIIQPNIFINFSSMSVYPDQDGIYNEKFKIIYNYNRDFLYGFSKYCSEILFDKFLNKNNKINIVHLRISQIYGKKMNQTRIIPIMKKELKLNNSITLFGNGKRRSNFININKLIKYIDFFLLKKLSGIYNIGDQNISYLKLAKDIIKMNGNKKSKIIKNKAGNKNQFILDTSKFIKVFQKYDCKK